MLETFTKIWAFAGRRHKSLLTAFAAAFIRSGFGITQMIAVIMTVDVLMGKAPVKSSVIWIAVLTGVCVAGNFIASYIEQISTMQAGFFMTGDKRISVGNILRKVPLGFFNDSSAGKITAVLTTTLSGVETAAAMAVISIVSGLFQALVYFVFMLFYDWRIGLLSGAGMLAYLLVVSWQMKVSRKNAPEALAAQSRLAEAALTFLQGIKVTKAFSFRKGDARLKEAIQGSSDANMRLTDKSMPSQFAASLAIAVFESGILLAALFFCFAWKDISVVKTMVLLIYSFMVYSSLNQAGSMLSMIGILDTGLSEVETLEKTEQMVCEEPVQKADSNEIVFDRVSFSYGVNEVLHSVSTTIQSGSLTAVIGPSGSGKTTLCQLIPRFRDVSEGTITIGGADVRHMEYEDLMKKISMVFQRVYLFEDTILNNIRFGKPDATLKEVRAAAKAARCDDFIMALPDGYDTRIAEGGNSLSGGEKQRISIARAILKDSPITILDEATSALDAENEYEILAAIDELTRNKTVIMIAHRLQTVQKADHIIAIENGRIVQEGTHEQLVKEPGLYADFIAARQKASGWKLDNQGI